jgi:hypothetical protein
MDDLTMLMGSRHSLSVIAPAPPTLCAREALCVFCTLQK